MKEEEAIPEKMRPGSGKADSCLLPRDVLCVSAVHSAQVEYQAGLLPFAQNVSDRKHSDQSMLQELACIV